MKKAYRKRKSPHCGNCLHFLSEGEDAFGMSWCCRHNHTVCSTDHCAQWEKENKQ